MYKLFIGYQAQTTTYNQVKNYLLSSIKHDYIIKKNKNKGKKKPNYINLTLTSSEDLKWLNETNHMVNNFQLTIQPFMSKEERRRQVEDRLKRRVYINGLPLNATERQLFENFSIYGDIDEVFFKISEKDNQKSKTLCYLTFASMYGLMNCLDSGDILYEGHLLELFLTAEYNLRQQEAKEKLLSQNTRTRTKKSKEMKETASNNSPDVNVVPKKEDKPFIDWMGEAKIEDKLTIKIIVRSGIRRPPYESTVRRLKQGRIVKSNIRFNCPYNQRSPFSN